MKIYNEIVWKWNDKAQTFEEVYADSYDYSGPISELQGYGGGSSGKAGGSSGGITNNDTPQNTDDDYGDMWHNENLEGYREAVSNRLSELLISKFSLSIPDNSPARFCKNSVTASGALFSISTFFFSSIHSPQ